MARVPSLPFRVVTYRKPVGDNAPQIENHNWPDLPGAWAGRDIALRKHTTRRVEVLLVLDESTPDHRDGAVAPTPKRKN
jgi:hypothetical protein